MTIEEAEKRLTPEHRTMITVVGENELGVKKSFLDGEEKPYIVFYAKDPKKPGLSGKMLGEYASLEEVQSSFKQLPEASAIDPNGWSVSPER